MIKSKIFLNLKRSWKKGGEDMNKDVIIKALVFMLAISWIFLLLNSSVMGAGADIYKGNCLICHGEGGDGKGPMAKGLTKAPRDFTNKAEMSKMADEKMMEIIRKGEGQMPAFAGVLKDEEIKEVISYIRQFAK